jgi:spoIIIJ-associated protein
MNDVTSHLDTPVSQAEQETPQTTSSIDTPSDEQSAISADEPRSDIELLEKEGEIAADYLEGLLDIADLDGDIDMDVEGERSSVAIVGDGLDDLVGEDGKGLEALQELTRLAVHVKTGRRSGLMLDIADYRKTRREEITAVTQEAIAEVQSTGSPYHLLPMTPFERKVVHDVVATAGLNSESDGTEPGRYVIILPA